MLALVTGSTGFLGSHLVEGLVAAGHRVRALVFGPSGDFLKPGPELELFPGDIRSPDSLVTAIEGVDTVFHTAALVSNWGPWSDFLDTTVHGTQNVLEAAARACVKRFVHISTIRVYDDRFCRRRGTVTEDAPLGRRGFRHFGCYARAKVLAEKEVWRCSDRLPVTVIRPAWLYGPRDALILPGVIRYLSDPGARWPCRTDPCADPIYVTDVADCAITAALTPAAVGQAYHAAPPTRITVRQFLGALAAALDIELTDRCVPYPLAAALANLSECWAVLTGRRSAPRYNRAGLAILSQDVRHSPAKAERELGWTAKIDLGTGVRLTAPWLASRLATEEIPQNPLLK